MAFTFTNGTLAGPKSSSALFARSLNTPPHDSRVGRSCVCPSVRPSILRPYIRPYFVSGWQRVNINGFSPNLVCALILWRSCLGLLMVEFRQILTELSARDTPIFPFPDDNLSKCQGILTKLGTRINIKKIWFGIANGQILLFFWQSYLPATL